MTDKIYELNEIAKSKVINRPDTPIFFFCNKVMESEYFTYQYKKDDENGDPVIERVRKVSREEKLYNKPEHIMTRRERLTWYSRFRKR